MIDSVIVIGVVIVVMGILKKSVPFFETETGLLYINLIMFIGTGLLNIINGLLFSGGIPVLSAVMGYFKDGLVLGAAASGIYGIGKDATASFSRKRRMKRGERNV
ncbi:hypothetical protein SDC9_65951 [bioreactor metagenome]|uniref:Holin n=1 Tax=bioreactor metagenome TaxID=1076179 RepID=A0A644XTP9_9ZZZZ